ncbi:protein kinase, partial [Acinetobacter baumannii]
MLDSFSENERDYLVLEYVPGATMRQLVKQGGAVNESKALDWAGQLASIVEFLHSQSPPVLHRDLSPDNIIIKENGQIIL